MTAGAQPGGVLGVGAPAGVVDEAIEALGEPGRPSWSHSTGVIDSVIAGARASSRSSSGR